uniref:HTH psq-type domain-containing protein n=1 Tax=Clastoptera arizonana TaxID=38151 RepID=A0A1B6E558_9HEMI
MATPTTKRPVRQLSIQEKLSAIQRVHNGESKASVARLIGVPESTLRGWCKNEVKLKGMLDKSLSFAGTSPSPPPEKKQRLGDGQEMDEALLFWMRNQQQQEASRNLINNNNDNNNHSSWFWRWYKQFGIPDKTNLISDVENTSLPPDEPISLVKRHSKDSSTTVLSNINKETKENNLSLIPSGAVSEDEDDTPPTAADALKHGELFLRWLECCSDPSVTAVQLLQFRYLLNNVKTCAQRKAANKSRSPSRSRRK